MTAPRDTTARSPRRPRQRNPCPPWAYRKMAARHLRGPATDNTPIDSRCRPGQGNVEVLLRAAAEWMRMSKCQRDTALPELPVAPFPPVEAELAPVRPFRLPDRHSRWPQRGSTCSFREFMYLSGWPWAGRSAGYSAGTGPRFGPTGRRPARASRCRWWAAPGSGSAPPAAAPGGASVVRSDRRRGSGGGVRTNRLAYPAPTCPSAGPQTRGPSRRRRSSPPSSCRSGRRRPATPPGRESVPCRWPGRTARRSGFRRRRPAGCRSALLLIVGATAAETTQAVGALLLVGARVLKRFDAPEAS